ncbi:DUF4192 domain-containing protein [Corynebacterium mustelae]|nr:DUF4192 domain-containing protein [Corynebacterium mustelae]
MTHFRHETSIPAEMLANLPAVLGFYPHESVIFTGFTFATETSLTLGPVLRVNIEDLQVLPEIGEALERIGNDVVFAFVISAQASHEHQLLEEIINMLVHASETRVVNIDACWYSSEITTGNPYRLLFDRASALSHKVKKESGGWLFGNIPDIAASSAMKSLVEAGDVPELNREESFRYFARETENSCAAHDCEIDERITQIANGMIAEIYAQPSHIESYIDRLRQILDAVAAQPDSVQPCDEFVEFCAAICNQVVLRDAMLMTFLTAPVGSKRLCLSVARSVSGVSRNNALCVYAICALSQHRNPKGFHALIASSMDDPEHSLTQLLISGFQAGIIDKLLACIETGCAHTLAQLGLEPSDSDGDARHAA